MNHSIRRIQSLTKFVLKQILHFIFSICTLLIIYDVNLWNKTDHNLTLIH